MKKQPHYRIMLGMSFFFTFLAVWTLWPMSASKPNALGYHSHCTFAPWSSLILLGMSGLTCLLRNEWYKGRRNQDSAK